jgi:hypothetical protein
MLKYLLRRGKEKVFGSDLRFSKTGLHDNVIPNVSCIMGDGSIVGESDPIVEDPGSIVGFSAATSNSNQSHTATIDIELTAEKTQDEISGDRLAMQKSSSVQERICKLKSQKSGTRHKRLYSLSSRFSQRRELDSSIKLSVPQSQSEVTSKPAVQHCQSCRAPMVVQSEHQDYPDQQAKDPDAEDIDHDGISISTLSSFATEMDEDGSCSSESDASVFKHKESEEPETFRQSLLHVINPFKKEDEEVSSDDSSSDSEVSSIRIDSEFVASFDDSRYSDEADEHFNDIPVRDPFEVYKSFFGSREGSKDSIACQSFGKDFPQSSTALEPAFSLTERQQSSSICYNRSLADVSHCSSKETVNRSNLTTRVHQRE